MLRDFTGRRGERIVEVCLTRRHHLLSPVFRPAFLGDKWPAIDFYVEITTPRGRPAYFFAQAKATAAPLPRGTAHINIGARRRDVAQLLRMPGPTYLFGVHEPSERVFVRSIHAGVPARAITRIPIAYELTAYNLETLYNEVAAYWSIALHKPDASEFS